MSRKKTDFYCQCTLKSPTGNEYTVSWLPEEYATAGALLSLKTNDVWRDWVVQSVGSKVEAAIVESHRDDYRTWREHTDI